MVFCKLRRLMELVRPMEQPYIRKTRREPFKLFERRLDVFVVHQGVQFNHWLLPEKKSLQVSPIKPKTLSHLKSQFAT